MDDYQSFTELHLIGVQLYRISDRIIFIYIYICIYVKGRVNASWITVVDMKSLVITQISFKQH